MNAVYLGYGVRAEHDESLNQVILKVDRSAATHFIALTQEELTALDDFTKSLPPLTGYPR